MPYYGPPIPVVYGAARVTAQSVYVSGNLGDVSPPCVYAVCEASSTFGTASFKALYAHDNKYTDLSSSGLAYVWPSNPSQQATCEARTTGWLMYSGDAFASGSAHSGTLCLFWPYLKLENGRVPDCDVLVVVSASGVSPADVATDLLTDPRYGYGLSASQLDVAAYRTYCNAVFPNGVGRALSDRTDSGTALQELCDQTNTWAFWSEGKMKFVPLGDKPTGSFAPVTSSVAIGPDDLIVDQGVDPVQVQRTPQSDVFNTFPISFSDVTADFITSVQQHPEPSHASVYGIRRATEYRCDWINHPAHALALSTILANRSVYQRNVYTFKLSPRWNLFEPGDFISLTEPAAGLSGTLVRIRRVQKATSSALTVEALEWPLGTAVPLDLTFQTQDGYAATVSYFALPATSASVSSSLASKANTDLGNITAQIGGANAVWNSSFESNTGLGSAVGLADYWDHINDAVNYSVQPSGAFGGNAQYFECSGAVGNGRLIARSSSLWAPSGTQVVLSWYASCSAGLSLYPVLKGYSGPNPYTTQLMSLIASSTYITKITNGWERVSASFTTNTGSWLIASPGLGNFPPSGTAIWMDAVQLELGTVATAYAPKTDEILPATVTSGALASGSVTIPAIATGSVTFPALVYNSFGGAALNTDPFCVDASAWTVFVNISGVLGAPDQANSDTGSSYPLAAPYGAIVAVTAGKVGTSTIHLSCSAGGSPTGSWLLSQRVPVSPLRQYRAHAWARRPVGDGQFFLRVYFFDVTGTLLQYLSSQESPTIYSGTWTEYVGTPASTPASAAFARLGVVNYAANTASYLELQDLRLEDDVTSRVVNLFGSDGASGYQWYRGNTDTSLANGAPLLRDPIWAPITAYKLGDRVCGDTQNLAYSNPGDAPYNDAGSYAPNNLYTRVYKCSQAGTSGGGGVDGVSMGGPTGTGTGIVDGTCKWDYVGTRSSQERMVVTNCAAQPIGAGALYTFQLSLTPQGRDNLDTLKAVRVKVYPSGSTPLIWQWWGAFPERIYYSPGTPSSNVVYLTPVIFTPTNGVIQNGTNGPFNGYLRIAIQNANGWSRERDYDMRSVAVNTTQYGSQQSLGGGTPAGASGGGYGGPRYNPIP